MVGRLLSFVPLMLASALTAQSAAPVHIWITVSDTAGAPMAGAQVSIVSSSGTNRGESTTDREGNVHLEVAPGSYQVQATARYYKAWAETIEAIPDRDVRAIVHMEIDCDKVICDVPVIAEIDLRPDLSALATPIISVESLESPLTIRTEHNSEPELATKAQLERLIAAHDLRRWTFTREIVVDEKAIPHSHPVLTLHTRHLQQDDELLSTYLHEQLHWFFEQRPAETKAAEQDLMKLYPDVPVGYPEGANDTESTYLHLLVCRLEQEADIAVLGEERTAAAMQFWAGDHYRWVYRTVLADGVKIDEILKRHGLAAPDARSVE